MIIITNNVKSYQKVWGKHWQHNNIYLGVALDENKNALAESIKKLLADNGVNNALVNNNLPQLISRGNVN